MVRISTELPAINQTPPSREKVEVDGPLARDSFIVTVVSWFPKQSKTTFWISILDSGFLAGPDIPWPRILLGRSTKQPVFENVERLLAPVLQIQILLVLENL